MSVLTCSSIRTAVLAAVSVLTLAGCVTSAEQTASQADEDWLAQTLGEDDELYGLDPERFYESAVEMVDTDIEFYGVVLDSEDQPIEGAQVLPTIFDRVVDPFEFPFFSFTAIETIETDKNGRFAITKRKGAGMYLTVRVEGLAPVSAPRRLYVYADGLKKSYAIPTRDAPAEFRFEEVPPEAQLRFFHTGALKLGEDGKPLEVSFRELSPYGVEPGAGEAIITCDRSLDDAEPHERFDWWCELTLPGGGMIDYRLDMERAPETGYEETGRLSFSADDPDWDDRADRELIIRFADGTYGYVTVSMRMDGDYYVAFKGAWNPTGSTWLD